jgi:hypothetical protein
MTDSLIRSPVDNEVPRSARRRAAALGAIIAGEDGVGRAVAAIEARYG